MAKYTKGNWRVIKNDINKPYKFRIETDTNILAAVYSEANAHLIAAAPIGDELADACLNNAESVKIKEIARRFKEKANG